MNPYNPTRTHLLARFDSLKDIVSGHEHYLFDSSGVKYLDFLSQYGVVSFGHNNPELVGALQQALAEKQPPMIQPFTAPAAQKLADKLKDITPGKLSCTVFANSGAEAAEAAIKLTRARTGKQVILSTVNGFHGKTLGALSATGNAAYQLPFGAPSENFDYVPFGDLDALAEKLQTDGERIAAFFVEPVQGEGGMKPAPPGYLAEAIELCRRAGVLTVFDEIQTGLGRTGHLFGATASQAEPDVMLLGKALGGGLMPIAACICRDDVWDHTFGLLHSSTFAGNHLACTVASAVIDLLMRDDQAIIKTVAQTGDYLFEKLTTLAEKYPDVIATVRGSGLMAGIEFHRFDGDNSRTMGFASKHGLMTAMFSGFLLNNNNIITAPVFNDAHFLRLEPPFTVGPAEVDRVITACDELCKVLRDKDYYKLFRYLTHVGDSPRPAGCWPSAAADDHQHLAEADDNGKPSFAFLVHYGSEDDYIRTDPSFVNFTPEEMQRWQRWAMEIGPGVMDHIEHLASTNGDSAEGWLLVAPMLPQHLLEFKPAEMQDMIQRTIDIAKSKGVGILGLGGFTSVITRGGERARGLGMPVTTGNSLTSIMAVQGLQQAAGCCGKKLSDLHVAVVGATGAIGRLCALMLADRAGKVTLVGNALNPDGPRKCRVTAGCLYKHMLQMLKNANGSQDSQLAGAALAARKLLDANGDELLAQIQPLLETKSINKMDALTDIMEQAFDAVGIDRPVMYNCDLDSGIKDADVVLVATNSDQALIYARQLKDGAIVCDVARPSNVDPALPSERPDVFFFEGGLVELPEPIEFGSDLRILPPGIALGCLAETALLAIEGDFSDHSIGQNLTLEEADYIAAIAAKHGFVCAPPEKCRRTSAVT